MEKIYSNRLGWSYIQFLDKKYGRKVTDTILEKSGLDRIAMSDTSGYYSLEESAALENSIIEVTGERDVPYQAGRNLPHSLGPVGGFIVGITSPAFLMRTFGQTEEKLAKKTINKTSRIGKDRYRVDITFKDGFKELPLVCRNRIGCYESAPVFFGLPYAKVEHPQCAHRGDDHCVYLIDFPNYRFHFLRRASLALILATMVLGGLWFAGIGSEWAPVAASASAILGLLSFSAYRDLGARKSLQWSLKANEGLAQQNQALETSNQRMLSLLDLTALMNKGSHVQDVCDWVVNLMVSEFKYGSCQIWLMESAQNMISCRAAIGYPERLKAALLNTQSSLAEDGENPFGLLGRTLAEKRSLIFNDPEDLVPKLPHRAQEHFRALNPSSLILSPLFHEGNAVGVLAAERHHGEKIDNQDRMLFQSISNIVTNALVKAELIENMEAKIRERTALLDAANRQLLAAKEMAIQSEKLSALGQMAAGVAHEINNPLNFLVNIIPEVRRDLEALEKIRALAVDAGNFPVLADRIRAIDGEYDLEKHLEEKSFVFEHIKMALDRSTRIANSLQVFSRSSAKEKVTRESFAHLLKETITLIPQKVRGDTVIDLDVPSDLQWDVNKIEIEQAFLALINNAIDAMGQKGRIHIQALQGPGELILAFKDEGPGIPAEFLKRIFDPFYTTKPPGKGTGLGLTIASEIFRKYGGGLSVSSETGKGATFSIRFRNDGR